MKSGMERRQFRRAELEVPVAIRSLSAPHATHQEGRISGQAKNISLSGVYCYAKVPCPLQAGDRVVCTVEIPPEQSRLFPFTRVTGTGWVVRTEPVLMGRRAGEHQGEDELIGLAVAFTPDVTALGSIVY